ncbi:MAG: histidine kinase [Mariniphaga sp.]|nr:histidine kinase [Mariniphaga sp.]
MKRLILITIFFFLASLLNLQAQEKFRYEETTWRIIRERLFNGTNTHAYRYEEDIKIQLVNASESDSAIVKQLVQELNELIEIVEVKIVVEKCNFFIDLKPPNNVGYRAIQNLGNNKITITHIELLSGIDSPEIFTNQVYFYCIKNLTKPYYPRNLVTEYGGIFDTHNAMTATFHEIDKDLIRKLYSKDFYKKLRINTTKNSSYLHYLKLRYKNPLKYSTIILGLLIALLTIFFIYYKGWFTNSVAKIQSFIYKGIVIVFVYSIVSYSISFWDYIQPYSGISSIIDQTISSFIFNWIMGLLVVFLMYSIEKKFFKIKKINISKNVIVFFSTMFSILIAMIIVIGGLLILSHGYINESLSPSIISAISLSLFAAFIRLFFIYLNHRTQSFINQKDVELAKMKELKNQTELNALHSRINPHFLYNSLNSIASLVHTDAGKTETMATSLFELFRYSINKEDKTYVRVEEELEMVRKYLEVEKIRFGEKLNYEIKTDENATDNQIPKFLIQPLVENAIKHGSTKITDQGKLKIEVKQDGKDLIITIYDNGPDFPKELISGYGLQNLHDKLQILYKDDAI